MAAQTMDRSGWCLKLPISKWNQEEHDKCYLHFQTRDCMCECGHKGERSLESRETLFQPYVPPKKQLVTKDEDDD
jgi:hypothetical protein